MVRDGKRQIMESFWGGGEVEDDPVVVVVVVVVLTVVSRENLWESGSLGECRRRLCPRSRYNRQDRFLGVSDLIDKDTRAQGRRMTLEARELEATGRVEGLQRELGKKEAEHERSLSEKH